MTTSLIIDTDAGIDDAVALLMALRHREYSVAAITTVNGNVALHHVVRNVGIVLDAVGAPDVPFFRGATRPLLGASVDAAHVHGVDGLGDAGLAPSQRQPCDERAAQAIVRLARERPGELTLVALGPLTNVALAICLEPRLPQLLKAMVMMGGAVQARGNATAVAEFNVYADPEAAALCFARGFHPVVLGWEATLETPLSWAEWDATTAGQVGQWFVRAMYKNYVKRARYELNRSALYLPDPLAMAVALDPLCAEMQPAFIAIETGAGVARGLAAADVRREAPQPNAQIVMAMNRTRFLTMLEQACA